MPLETAPARSGRVLTGAQLARIGLCPATSPLFPTEAAYRLCRVLRHCLSGSTCSEQRADAAAVGREVAVLGFGHVAVRVDLQPGQAGSHTIPSPGIVTWPFCPWKRIVTEPSG